MTTLTDARNLPAPVLARLAELDEAARRQGITETELDRRLRIGLAQRGRRLEARPFARVERSDVDPDADEWRLSGYATVYDYPYPIAGGPERGGWNETIAGGACTKSVRERDDVRLLFDHDGIPLARTVSKTLTLDSDEIGLHSDATLDKLSPHAQSVASALRRGDADQMSFAFRVTRQEWNDDYTERVIREVMLFDVSVVTYPANPATVVGLRAELGLDDEHRSGGLTAAAVARAVEADRARRRALARL